MAKITKNFLGLPVEGDISFSRTPVKQRPISELEPLLSAVVNHPDVKALRWTQYTPYFNDGEPCEFGLGEITVLPAGLSPLEEYEGGIGENEDNFVDHYYDEFPQSALTAFKSLVEAFHSYQFNDALLELFGDHATVTIWPGKTIEVEFYEHG